MVYRALTRATVIISLHIEFHLNPLTPLLRNFNSIRKNSINIHKDINNDVAYLETIIDNTIYLTPLYPLYPQIRANLSS